MAAVVTQITVIEVAKESISSATVIIYDRARISKETLSVHVSTDALQFRNSNEINIADEIYIFLKDTFFKYALFCHFNTSESTTMKFSALTTSK